MPVKADIPKSTAAPGESRVLMVAPTPPPYGGMALQARLLEDLLYQEGVPIVRVASNLPFPPRLRAAARVPGLRTALRFGMLWIKLLREMPQADVVHVFACSWTYFFLVVYPAVAAGRLYGKRVVLNYRGGEAGRFFRYFGWAAWPVFRMADTVTAPSRFLAEVLGKCFGTDVAIVPNVLDTRLFSFRQRTRFRPNIVTARHLEAIYDVESVLRAFRLIQESWPDATLTIAGTGSQEGRLRGLASAWNLKNVQFLGCVPHDDLPAIYDRCDIFLNASRVDNFPGALLEASAAGLAVVSTDAGGIPWIYEHGKTALLSAPGDWQGLAQAVLKVLDSTGGAAHLTRAAAELVRACEWSAVRQALFQVYRITDRVKVPV